MPQKAEENRRKHGVSFDEATTIFDDPLAISYPDPDHSEREARALVFGLSSKRRLLVVSYSESDDTVRIISARAATPSETAIYEEG